MRGERRTKVKKNEVNCDLEDIQEYANDLWNYFYDEHHLSGFSMYGCFLRADLNTARALGALPGDVIR